MRKLPILLLFVFVGTAHAQLGVGINKNSTLTGTGSTASPLGVNMSLLAGNGLTQTATTFDVGAGTGISVGANSISVDTSVIQAKVTGTCTTPSAITGVNTDGTVSCSSSSIDGAGTAGRSSRWTDANTLATGAFTDDGTNAVAQGTLGTLGAFTAGDTTADSHRSNGNIQSYETIGATLTSLDSFGANLTLLDDTALAADTGGGIAFGQKYTSGGLYNNAGAVIRAAKTNATDSNFASDLLIGTRPNGGSITERLRIKDTGAIHVGDVGVGSVSNNVDVLTLGNTGTGQTSDTDLIDLSHSGSVSAAGAARTTVGIRSTMTTSVTDYTNEVTTIAGRFESAGITDTNYGIQAIATSPSGCGAPCTSLGITTAVALYANTTGGGINYAAIFENGMVAIGDTVFIGQDKAAADDGDETLYIESDATGLAFDYTALSTNAAVTLDATAAARASFGVFGGSYAARSAGANDVTNYGLYGDASGGQVNYALYTEDGSAYLNSSSGTTGIGAAPVSTTKLLVSKASSSASFIAGNSAMTIRDEADAAGVGGGIEFQGNYNGAGTPTEGALIKLMKTNGTAGNHSFDLVLGTRPHGGNLTEVLRLYDGAAAIGAKITGGLVLDGKQQAIGTDPVVSTCGTSPTIVGSDLAGTVTVGSGTATSCTVTFASTYTAEPACVITNHFNNASPMYFSAKSATAFTVTTPAAANFAGTKINYVCFKM